MAVRKGVHHWTGQGFCPSLAKPLHSGDDAEQSSEQSRRAAMCNITGQLPERERSGMCALSDRRPRRLGGGKGGESREPKPPKDAARRGLAAPAPAAPGAPLPPPPAPADRDRDRDRCPAAPYPAERDTSLHLRQLVHVLCCVICCLYSDCFMWVLVKSCSRCHPYLEPFPQCCQAHFLRQVVTHH
jgi:hypothetical protein